MEQRTFLIGFICAVCLVFSLPAQAAKRSRSLSIKEKPDKDKNFSKQIFGKYYLSVPKGWECIADKTQLPAKVELVMIGSGKGQFTPSINLATEKTELSIEGYFKLAKEYHESQGETNCRSLGKLDTIAGTVHLLQIDRKTQWGIVRFLQATLVKEGCAYVITGTCLQEDFNQFSSQFLNTIQSFTINQV